MSVTRPCINTGWAFTGVSKLMVVPFARIGWSSLQNGPRIADAVRPSVLLVAAVYVISSTSLISELLVFESMWCRKFCLNLEYWFARSLRFQADNVTQQLALVAFIVAHLPSPVYHVHTHHPFVGCKLHFPCKIVDVRNERSHNFPKSGVSLRPRGIDYLLGESFVEVANLTIWGREKCHD